MTGIMYPEVGADNPNADIHRREIAERLASISQGRTNNTIAVTLTANAASTTVTDTRIAFCSALLFSPCTANAAAELAAGTLYVAEGSRVNGAAVSTHAEHAQTDRTFRMAVIG